MLRLRRLGLVGLVALVLGALGLAALGPGAVPNADAANEPVGDALPPVARSKPAERLTLGEQAVVPGRSRVGLLRARQLR